MKYLLIICAINFTLLFLMHHILLPRGAYRYSPSIGATHQSPQQTVPLQPANTQQRPSILYRGIILLTRSYPSNVASAASIGGNGGIASSSSDEYPALVQELVMNGFELQKVLCAYDLIGDNFDDLLSFLLSQTSS